MSTTTGLDGLSPADLLRLAHAEFMADTSQVDRTVHFNHPGPLASWGGRTMQRYVAVLAYPGTVLVSHTPYQMLSTLVAASRPGCPDTPHDDAPDPQDPYTAAERAALLRKAAAALRKVPHLSVRWVSIRSPASASGDAVAVACFAFPGVVTVFTHPVRRVLAVSHAGHPTAVDIEATSTALSAQAIEKGQS